ncbi:hypothetical protein ACM40_03955 [Chryseobacterium sp. BLS98]|uniref:T9SS type A sorting domain-containing protein n=1 Tax=Chryseobacterium sp. BLS98 TaxID=885586 RepID=UPI00065AB445|nr:T9SS type A sorting domain-containing protein [Chryseobacterium sp. BLS98]KMQ63932.1 hypothetical protein ACM40_03955 [Chryseobacterium sp. BLS98]
MKKNYLFLILFLLSGYLLKAQTIAWYKDLPTIPGFPYAGGVVSATDSSDNIYAGWTSQRTSPNVERLLCVAKYNSAGELDPTFGNGGITNFSPILSSTIVGLKVLTGGKIVLFMEDGTALRVNSDGTQDTSFGYNGIKQIFEGVQYYYRTINVYEYDNHSFITNSYKDIFNNYKAEIICLDQNLNADPVYLNQGRLDVIPGFIVSSTNKPDIKGLYFYNNKIYLNINGKYVSEYDLHTGVKNFNYGNNGESGAYNLAAAVQYGKPLYVNMQLIGSNNRPLVVKRFLPDMQVDPTFSMTSPPGVQFQPDNRTYILPNNQILISTTVDISQNSDRRVLLCLNPNGDRDIGFGGMVINPYSTAYGVFDVSSAIDIKNPNWYIHDNYLIGVTSRRIAKILYNTTTLSSVETEKPSAKIELVPNPVSDKAQLMISEVKDKPSAAIYSADGRKISEMIITQRSTELDFSLLPSGNYIIKIQNKDRKEALKFIKK